MATPSSRKKWCVVVIVVIVLAFLVSLAIPAFIGSNRLPAYLKELSDARQICVACKIYAYDHAGNFPPSLDALFPTYLDPEARSLFVSPYMPSEPVGYTYTPPALKNTASANTIVLEDKFAPLHHLRIVVYADDSGSVIDDSGRVIYHLP